MIKPHDIKVLVAEDEKDLREILASRFRVFGFQTLEATGGDEAYKMFESHPDISTVVTDIRMPNGTGIELLNKLKSLNSAYPKVFIASSNTDHSKQELFELGAEGILEKPYDTKTLIDMVRKSLLTNKERWQMPPNFSVDIKLEESFSSYEEACSKNLLKLGRGGLCLQTSKPLPPVESFFHLKIQAHPLEINAVVKLKWVSPVSGNNKKIGVEFFHIGGANATGVYEWIETHAPVAYIPNF